MSKIQREESLDHSEEGRPRRRNREQEKGKDKHLAKTRMITHYFTFPHTEKKKHPINRNIPTPDKKAIQQMQEKLSALEDREAQITRQADQWRHRKEQMRINLERYLIRSRLMLAEEARKTADLERFLKRQPQPQKIGLQIMKLQESIRHRKALIQEQEVPLSAAQLHFLQRQMARDIDELQHLRREGESQKQRARLLSQEQNCSFAREKWPLLVRRYQVLQLIGKGGFSEVYKAFDVIGRRQVAVKLSSLEQLVTGAASRVEYLKHVRRQYEIHRGLRHPNIVQLIEVIELDNQSVCIVLEFCSGPVLSSFLRSQGKISQKQAKMIIWQLVGVLKYLSAQEPAVIHYDLKPQNIIFNQGLLKVLDFGICKILESDHSRMALTSQGIGTYLYLPPQTFLPNNPTISNKVDIWSLGVIFYELLHGRKPFSVTPRPKNPINLTFTEEIASSGAQQFIRACLSLEQRDRIDATGAYNHDYFKDLKI